MPQAIWTGTISFGLVSVPVKLYSATRKKDVRFHELDRLTGGRVRHERVRNWPLPAEPVLDDIEVSTESAPSTPRRATEAPPASIPPTDRRVSGEELVKGFEVAADRYVTVSRLELAELAPERTQTIDIEQFVDAATLDPIYYDTSYYVVPDRDHLRSFALLLEAMQQTHQLGISWIVLRRKRHLAALRAYGGVMLLTTMLHADEVLPTPEVELPDQLTKKERDMAALLVRTLSGPFQIERYRDEYRERLMELIEGRAATAQPLPQPAATSGAVQDLMAALKASVERARRQRIPGTSKPARRGKRKSA